MLELQIQSYGKGETYCVPYDALSLNTSLDWAGPCNPHATDSRYSLLDPFSNSECVYGNINHENYRWFIGNDTDVRIIACIPVQILLDSSRKEMAIYVVIHNWLVVHLLVRVWYYNIGETMQLRHVYIWDLSSFFKSFFFFQTNKNNSTMRSMDGFLFMLCFGSCVILFGNALTWT